MYEYLKNKRALYVEDELDVLQNISELLENYFEKFYQASTGEIAFEIVMKEHIDILIVDIELPKMNGIELIQKIRKEHSDIRIVVVSAYTKTDYFLECIEYQIERYIIKPFTSRKINELLQKLNETYKNIDSEKIIRLDDDFLFKVNLSQLFFKDELVSLTKKEKALLLLFLENRNSLIKIDLIEYEIWPDNPSSDTRRRTLISRLRSKLQHRFIETSSSEGYIFTLTKEKN